MGHVSFQTCMVFVVFLTAPVKSARHQNLFDFKAFTRVLTLCWIAVSGLAGLNAFALTYTLLL